MNNQFADLNLVRQRASAKVKKNARWPEIDLEASFTRNGIDNKYRKSWDDMVGKNKHEAFVGMTFRFPLENRLARSELKEAELHKAQTLLNLKRTERLILKEITNNVKDINTLKSKIGLLTHIVELEDNKLKEEMKLLGYGKSDSDTVIRFEEDLLLARLQLAYALFDYRVSTANLERTKNTLLDEYWHGEL